jgi:hypothetical protein
MQKKPEITESRVMLIWLHGGKLLLLSEVFFQPTVNGERMASRGKRAPLMHYLSRLTIISSLTLISIR